MRAPSEQAHCRSSSIIHSTLCAMSSRWTCSLRLPLSKRPSPCSRIRDRPRLINITSDASIEHYERWGGYGLAKAALDHLSATLGTEEPGSPLVGRRSRRPPYRHASAGVPRRRHLGQAAPRVGRPAARRPDRERPAERPVQGERDPGEPDPRERRQTMSAPSATAPVATETEPTRRQFRAAICCRSSFPPSSRLRFHQKHEGSPATRCGCSLRDRGDGRLVHTYFSELPRLLGRGRPRRREHIGNTCCRHQRHHPLRALRRGASVDPSAGGIVDNRAPARARSAARCASRRVDRAGRRGRVELLTPYSRQRLRREALGGDPQHSWSRRELSGGPRQAHPVRIREGLVADHDVPERLLDRARLRRDAERGTTLHA